MHIAITKLVKILILREDIYNMLINQQGQIIRLTCGIQGVESRRWPDIKQNKLVGFGNKIGYAPGECMHALLALIHSHHDLSLFLFHLCKLKTSL